MMDIDEPIKKREFETVLPMINIVFLLLIFFMLAGAFTKPDLFKVVIPEAHMKADADRDRLTIVMSSDNEFAIEKQAYTKEQLVDEIKSQVNKNSELKVQLKADQAVKSKDLLGIMDELGTTGLASINLLTLKAKSSGSTAPIQY